MNPSAGWYFDPEGRPRYRFWDGRCWTEHVTDEWLTDPLAARADQQEQWLAAGDIRGVFGESGAEIMRFFTETPREPLGTDAKLASLATNETELSELVTEQPPMWAHSAFLSTMMLRRAALVQRLQEAKLGFADPKSNLDRTAASLLLGHAIDEYITLQEGLAGLMTSPAFETMFDVEQRDPHTILLAANRLMDYHEKFLELCEKIRNIRSTSTLVRVQKGMWELTLQQLNNFDVFIERFATLLERGEEGLRYGSGEVNLGHLRLGGGLDEDSKTSLLELKEHVLRQL